MFETELLTVLSDPEKFKEKLAIIQNETAKLAQLQSELDAKTKELDNKQRSLSIDLSKVYRMEEENRGKELQNARFKSELDVREQKIAEFDRGVKEREETLEKTLKELNERARHVDFNLDRAEKLHDEGLRLRDTYQRKLDQLMSIING